MPSVQPMPSRVQRLVDDLPVLHLEPAIPEHDGGLALTGLVERPQDLSGAELQALPRHSRQIDVHCTWGWTRQRCAWEGVILDDLLQLSGMSERASHVQLFAAGGHYQTCLSLEDARAGIVAFALDGTELTPEHGAPMRFVVPPVLWHFKGPKWLREIRLVDSFLPGFWEVGVNDAEGRIPADVLARLADFEALRERLETAG